VTRKADSSKKPPVWKMIAVAAVVLVAIAIVLLKPRGDSVTEPSSVSPPRAESMTQKSLSEPAVSVPPASRPEAVTEKRPTNPEPSSPPPPKPEVNPPENPPPQTKLPLLLDIGSTTCIPCKKMAPILQELEEEFEGVVEIEFIDIYKETGAASKYRIIVIPTQIFYDQEGKEFYRHLGFMGKEEILKVFGEMGVEL
jgi:thioredoxin 1